MEHAKPPRISDDLRDGIIADAEANPHLAGAGYYEGATQTFVTVDLEAGRVVRWLIRSPMTRAEAAATSAQVVDQYAPNAADAPG